ncbi:MAG: hypothetical protein HF976_06070 [ANME-2 cluster archaeon]|nr:hypothetical protein [ANME-2 cluster archaeon]
MNGRLFYLFWMKKIMPKKINHREHIEHRALLILCALCALCGYKPFQEIIKSHLNGRAIFMSTAAVGEANDI